jgi:hypothetical protein
MKMKMNVNVKMEVEIWLEWIAVRYHPTLSIPHTSE